MKYQFIHSFIQAVDARQAVDAQIVRVQPMLLLLPCCYFADNVAAAYIALSAFQTPLTPKVTGGASTITWYTKYSPPDQHAG